MTAQIKLTLDNTLAKKIKATAKELGYLSTQEFIVEAARKRVFIIEGMKALQGINQNEPKKITEEEYEQMILNIEQGKKSHTFRKLNLNRIPRA
ncbi:MAG: hypothetical protein ACMXYF_03030 [Candidatus Woesearchaeota archaeon]